MATNKTGLDYFPFDVDFFDDDKLLFVGARFGLKGENIAIRLLCKIYSEGYFYKFGEDESLLFAKRVGDGCQYSFVNDVVHELVKRGFFDRSIFDRFTLLTSTGIQKRYFEAVNRRKNIEVFEDLLLVDVSKMDNVTILSHNDYIIDKNGNILKQKKVKESKEKESNIPPLIPPGGEKEKSDYEKFQDWVKEHTPTVAKISRQITEEEFYKLKGKYNSDQIVEVLEQMENYKGVQKKYTWLYKTFLNWAEKRYGK